ncbi:MAG: diguanylate cyclase [Betaproteobacteria bacterium]|nr:MAG: diguanylate cyclase [Betaproteobacteria bacterium]
MVETTAMGDAITPGRHADDSGSTPHVSRAILQAFLDYLPSGVSMLDADLMLVAYNTQFKQVLEFPDELFASGPPSLARLIGFNARRGDYGPGDPDAITVAAVERARKMEPHVFERTRPNGTVLEVRGTPLPGGGFVSIYTDITERKQTEKALRASEAELRLLTDNVPAMILYVDRGMNCMFANKRYADFFGLVMTDIVGKPLREIVGETAYQDLQIHFDRAFEGHSVAYQRNVKFANGEQRCLDVKLVPRTEEQGRIPGCYSMAIDITEQKLAAERIQHLAHHDSLTGLPNRMLFNDRLGQAISLGKRDSSRFALLYLDLDKFKPVNDTLGHDAGDELLKSAAARIREQVRESDTVARVGGDEFTVILRDIPNRESVAAVAEKIIAALSTPFRLERQKQSVRIGTSVGIAVYPDDAPDHETLIKLADASMYKAKVRGSCFHFFGT